jgi:proton-coupled amino acid transporter
MAEPRKFKRVFGAAMACVAVILAAVSNLCVAAFGEVTNGSVTAFLLEEYKDNKSLIVFLMIANTTVSLSVLFTYPLQLFPTLELIGPKAAKFWWKFRHGGRGGQSDNDDNEHDLEGFEPMPTLPEHDVASLSSHDNDNMYEDFEKVSPNANGADTADLTRTSMVSNITDAFPTVSIPGDSLFLRTALVFLTYSVAVIVPNVQVLISLAGAIAGSSTALLIPPMLELALIDHLESKPDTMSSPKVRRALMNTQSSSSTFRLLCSCNFSGKYWKKKLKCFILFWAGFVFMLIGAYASISDIVSIWFHR